MVKIMKYTSSALFEIRIKMYSLTCSVPKDSHS